MVNLYVEHDAMAKFGFTVYIGHENDYRVYLPNQTETELFLDNTDHRIDITRRIVMK
jgi:hypothetical protein